MNYAAAEKSIAGNPLYFTGIQNYTLVNSQYDCHAKGFATAEEAQHAKAQERRFSGAPVTGWGNLS